MRALHSPLRRARASAADGVAQVPGQEELLDLLGEAEPRGISVKQHHSLSCTNSAYFPTFIGRDPAGTGKRVLSVS